MRGRVGPEELTAACFDDPEVLRLIASTTVGERARHQARFPAGRWADITLVLKDGRRLESGDVEARGDLSDPLSRDEIVAKFDAYATPVVGEARCAAIKRAVFSLSAEDARLSDLFELVFAPAG